MNDVWLVDDAATGHHPYYLRLLVEHWAKGTGAGRLTLLLCDDYQRREPDLLTSFRRFGCSVRSLQLPRVNGHVGSTSARRVAWEQTSKLLALAENEGATHLSFLNADSHLPRIAFGRTLRVAVSGIYFRPSFHYPSWFGSPVPMARVCLERLVLRGASRNRRLFALFCLDPHAVVAARRFDENKLVWLPEPCETPLDAGTRQPTDRFELLCFGHQGPQKGLGAVIHALSTLEPELQRRVRLRVVGSAPPSGRDLPTENNHIEIVVESVRVSDADMARRFRDCDAVLVAYPRHVGSSGVLVRAARYGKPVLAGEFGLVGHWTRRHRLGVTARMNDLESVRAGLRGLLSRNHAFDPDAARRFSQHFSEQRFCEVFFAHTLG